jgi:hypothetical protein
MTWPQILAPVALVLFVLVLAYVAMSADDET